MSSTFNHDVMKKENILSVLRCIIEHGPISKRSVKEITGLSWGSVSAISNELVKNKIIDESKVYDGHIGRTPLVLDICHDNYLIIGLNFNLDSITGVLMDIKHNVICTIDRKLTEMDRDNVINQAFYLIDTIYNKYDSDKSKIIGIGIAMQASVDSAKGISNYTPYYSNWDNVPIVNILKQKYDIPVFLDHIPNCRALCERWMGSAKGISNYLFIAISMGIGMSIIINGEIYKGSNGNAGEIGHITMVPDGKKCVCGNYGCLETLVSVRSIIERAVEGVLSGKDKILEKILDNNPITDIDIAMLYKAVNMGDKYCSAIFDEMAVYLGIAISNIINLFNPELIIIGGELSQYESLFVSKLKETVEKRTWKSSVKDILVSGLTGNTGAIGAGLILVQKIFDGELELNMKIT